MNRWKFLRTVGTATGGGFCGCLGSDRLAAFGSARPDLDAAGADWPTFGADRANTGHAPDAAGPAGDADVVWQFDAGRGTADASGSSAIDASEGTTAPSPVVVGDAVFTGGPGDDPTLYALDAESDEPYWEFDAGSRVAGAPAVVGDAVYVGTDDGRFHAVDARSGEERWHVEFDGAVESSPAVADGRAFVDCSDGCVYALGE